MQTAVLGYNIDFQKAFDSLRKLIYVFEPYLDVI